MMFFRSAVLAALSLCASAPAVHPLGLREAAAPGGGAPASADAALAAARWQDGDRGAIDAEVLALALQATACAIRFGDVSSLPPTLTVIDYSKPSTAERLWVFDTASHELLYRELVAHGQGSGENFATRFSNTNDSHQSSVGLFVTDDTYVGRNGYSLRMRGLEAGFNDRAYERAIVMHGAPYVSTEFARRQGRLGRSWGCPALPETAARPIIDRVKRGGVVFAYANDAEWRRRSKYLSASCAPAAAPAAVSTF